MFFIQKYDFKFRDRDTLNNSVWIKTFQGCVRNNRRTSFVDNNDSATACEKLQSAIY